MTTYWHCLTCPAHGTGDKEAEAHTKSTGHGTTTSHPRSR